MESNLEKYEFVILVFFQAGVLDTSKYSTSNLKVEKNGKSQSESSIILDQSESFISKSEIKLELSKWDYTWTFPTGSPDFRKYSTWNWEIEKTGRSNQRREFKKGETDQSESRK